MEKLLQYWPILVGVAQGIMLWVLWSMKKSFVTSDNCVACRKSCRKEVAEAVEKDLKRLPSNDALGALATQLEGLRGDVKTQGADLRGLTELLKRVEHPLNLLMEHHLRDSRGGRA